jgi:hypothetical protein
LYVTYFSITVVRLYSSQVNNSNALISVLSSNEVNYLPIVAGVVSGVIILGIVLGAIIWKKCTKYEVVPI